MAHMRAKKVHEMLEKSGLDKMRENIYINETHLYILVHLTDNYVKRVKRVNLSTGNLVSMHTSKKLKTYLGYLSRGLTEENEEKENFDPYDI